MSNIYKTKESWFKKGSQLFGHNKLLWKFKCPSCNRVQSPMDLKPFKDKGATPNDAYQKCIGRFTGGKNGPHKCDWASFGLFSGPDTVMDGKTKIPVFEFFLEGE